VVSFSRPNRRERRVRAVTDGEVLLETSKDVLAAAGIGIGATCDLGELRTRIAESEPRVARERALLLLGHRERSRHELQERLEGEGLSCASVTTTLDRLEESGTLSNERFTDSYARSKTASGWGRPRITRELMLKGVSDDLATDILDEYAPLDEEISRAQALLENHPLDTPKARNRALGRLARKGYAPSDALAALRLHRNNA